MRASTREVDAATSRIGRSVKEASDTLSVGPGLLTAANVFPGAIREFHGQRPDVRVQLFDADMTTIVERIKAGLLDVGFGFLKSAAGVSRTRFFRFSLMVIRPRRTPLHGAVR